MPNTSNHTLETPTSARELRHSVKQMQLNDAYLRVYMHLGQRLFEHGWNETTASALLSELCTLFAADHGLIATEDSGKLTVVSSRGRALPMGTRVPMMGVLANILRKPVRFTLQQGRSNSLWTHLETADFQDYIIPIAYQQQSFGIIALTGKHLIIHQEDSQTLHAMAGILGMAMLQQQPSVHGTVDRSVLDHLTPREREIFALLPMGLSNIELGEKLGIAPGTAKIHVERILNKLNVKDRTQAAVKAVELGYKS